MSSQYPPLARCNSQHTMIRIDRSLGQCALEHGCRTAHTCPLAGHFASAYDAYRQPDVGADGNRSAF